ncbi:MAG: hypothetical protein ACOWYE_16730 [Desulfatiglandales bacterium]
MTEDMLIIHTVKELFENDHYNQAQIPAKFESLGPFGEFGWRYLEKRLGTTDSREAVRDRHDFQRQLTKTLIEKYEAYSRHFKSYLNQGLSCGKALEKAMETLSPFTPLEREVVEFCLKWTALENILSEISKGVILETIAGHWGVSDKWIREAYDDFLEVMVSDYLGKEHYEILPSSEQEDLRNSFLKVLTGAMSLQEYTFLVAGLKARQLRRLRSLSVKELFAIPREKGRFAVKLFLENGGKIDESTLIAWARGQGINQEELEDLLVLTVRDSRTPSR